jgi:hypothetical protein
VPARKFCSPFELTQIFVIAGGDNGVCGEGG